MTSSATIDGPSAPPAPALQQPWHNRFGWFWYNDQEIFHDDDAALDAKVQAFAEQRINHLITFSCTHFRWSFQRWWPLLAKTLGRIAESCHQHGIVLTEHSSAIVVHDITCAEDQAYLQRLLKVRKSSIESWPELLDDIQADPLIDGVRLSAMLQVDGATGHYSRTPYRATAMCMNNPDYRAIYFAYLQTLYEAGIDGIMTDDVQMFGQGCACRHCRRLFHEQTGYNMPESGEAWRRWYGDHDDPTFRAWIDFRYRSIEDYHLAVDSHYESLGRRLLRPDYQSHCLNWNLHGSCLENKPTLDWIFQESCFSTIIRYSWIHYLIEQSHRQMVSRQRDIPHMIMFYPDRDDTMRFSWALSRWCGALYTGTPEGERTDYSETAIRDFESRHHSRLFGNEKLADIALFDSKRNRELNPDYWHLNGHSFWMQTCLMHNLQFELVQAQEADRLMRYPLVLLVKQALMSRDEIRLLRQYVQQGGTLLIHQQPGILDESGTRRSDTQLRKLWQWEYPCDNDFVDGQAEFPHGKGRYLFVDTTIACSRPFSEPDGTVRENTCDYQFNVTADRWQDPPATTTFSGTYGAVHDAQTRLAAALREALPGEPILALEPPTEGILVSAFREPDGSLDLQLVNAVGCFDIEAGAPVSHTDPIPFPTLEGTASITLADQPTCSRCTLHTLADSTGQPLEVEPDGDRLTLHLPLNLLHDYALIHISP